MRNPSPASPRRAAFVVLVRRTLAVALFASVGASVTACQTPTCVVDAERLQCRCGDGTYGYQRCVLAGNGQSAWEMHCDCTIGLSPDATGPSTLDAAAE